MAKTYENGKTEATLEGLAKSLDEVKNTLFLTLTGPTGICQERGAGIRVNRANIISNRRWILALAAVVLAMAGWNWFLSDKVSTACEYVKQIAVMVGQVKGSPPCKNIVSRPTRPKGQNSIVDIGKNGSW